MQKLRRKGVEFKVTGKIPTVKATDLVDGILLTYDSHMIKRCRAHENAEEVFRERYSDTVGKNGI